MLHHSSSFVVGSRFGVGQPRLSGQTLVLQPMMCRKLPNVLNIYST
ncbi:hypothetical protein HMPREF0742_01381 [Rothia aeria F0184]|uniref:Uncharacterized protein n=1 Tax=Rothia aeria F0184 TaxID=888019 RepID=U7V2S0_9MICC|nr:hypothetical protein HMPREF0742_01381 [Rothia aeria F0184]